VKSFLLGLLRLLLAFVVILAGPVGGFFVGIQFCLWRVVPQWTRDSPHDGQLGLGVFMYGIGGAFLGSIAMAVLVLVWIFHEEIREYCRYDLKNDPIKLFPSDK